MWMFQSEKRFVELLKKHYLKQHILFSLLSDVKSNSEKSLAWHKIMFTEICPVSHCVCTDTGNPGCIYCSPTICIPFHNFVHYKSSATECVMHQNLWNNQVCTVDRPHTRTRNRDAPPIPPTQNQALPAHMTPLLFLQKRWARVGWNILVFLLFLDTFWHIWISREKR